MITAYFHDNNNYLYLLGSGFYSYPNGGMAVEAKNVAQTENVSHLTQLDGEWTSARSFPIQY